MKKLVILAVACALLIPAIAGAQVVRVGPGWYSTSGAPQWVTQPMSGVFTPVHPGYKDRPCDWAGSSPFNGVPQDKKGLFGGIFKK